VNWYGQFDALTNNPDIIIATPGRLAHHLQEIPDFNLRVVELIVFDEVISRASTP
jgi:ATP-dependent RNA helicase DDX54/DBP10